MMETQNSIHSASSGLFSTLRLRPDGMLSKAEASKRKTQKKPRTSHLQPLTSQLGISLFEILVVLAVFGLIAAVSTHTVVLTLRGAKKSDTQGRVRENLGYALSVIERQLHNATYVSPCPNPDTSIIDYEDQEGLTTSFSCLDIGSAGYVASASARLTSEEIGVTSCTFVCEAASGNVPPSIRVSLEAIDPDAQAIEGAKVTISTKVFLRTY